MRVTLIANVLRDAGLKVAETDGWRGRGREFNSSVLGIICHHTAGLRAGNMPSLRTLINGRSDLPGPLCQLGLGRDGTFYIVADGRANHAGKGSWHGITMGNSSTIGIEAENTGVANDLPWPDVQMKAYAQGCAAILKHYGLSKDAANTCASDHVAGHKEYALPKGRKNDPDFDMAQLRRDVQTIVDGVMPSPVLIPAVDPVTNNPTLRRGNVGALVKVLQLIVDVKVDGNFGAKTEAAVRVFQRKHNLTPDGIVGPKTWQSMLK